MRFSVVQDIILKTVYLSGKYKIVAAIFIFYLQDTSEMYLDKEEDTFRRHFLKILFTLCKYSIRIMSPSISSQQSVSCTCKAQLHTLHDYIERQCVSGLVAAAGVWLRATETEISAALWTLVVRKGL